MAAKKERIAEQDIVRRNELGQNVVIVPKGQPIPEGFDEDEAAARSVPIRQAEDAETVAGEDQPKRSSKKGAATENKKAE